MHIHTLSLETRAVQRRPLLIASDLLIDGTALLQHVERATGKSFDLASPLGWMPTDYSKEWAARIVGASPAVLESGRCELLVCPECGDLGCGCVSCVVHREGELVVWSELAWETDYPDLVVPFRMGGFRFRAGELCGILGVSRVEQAVKPPAH